MQLVVLRAFAFQKDGAEVVLTRGTHEIDAKTLAAIEQSPLGQKLLTAGLLSVAGAKAETKTEAKTEARTEAEPAPKKRGRPPKAKKAEGDDPGS